MASRKGVQSASGASRQARSFKRRYRTESPQALARRARVLSVLGSDTANQSGWAARATARASRLRSCSSRASRFASVLTGEREVSMAELMKVDRGVEVSVRQALRRRDAIAVPFGFHSAVAGWVVVVTVGGDERA